jgi:hypothetical protein
MAVNNGSKSFGRGIRYPSRTSPKRCGNVKKDGRDNRRNYNKRGGGVNFKTLAAICFACSEFRGNVTGLDVTSVIKFERN